MQQPYIYSIISMLRRLIRERNRIFPRSEKQVHFSVIVIACLGTLLDHFTSGRRFIFIYLLLSTRLSSSFFLSSSAFSLQNDIGISHFRFTAELWHGWEKRI
jgi:hypothetical protein